MKKLILIATSIAILLASCTRAEMGNGAPDGINFSAGFMDSKVALSADGDRFSACWSNMDTVGIFCSAVSGPDYPYIANVDAADASACIFSPLDYKREFSCQEQDCIYYAYYPYSSASTSASDARFSLPSRQVQAKDGSTAHLGRLMPFISTPQEVKATDGKAELQFKPLFSVVELDIDMKQPQQQPVLISNVALTSGSTPIASDAVSCDITAENPVISAGAPSEMIELTLSECIKAGVGTPGKAYLVALPARYDKLEAKITAINGAVATVGLPAVTFSSGGNYAHPITLEVSDFVAAAPFGVSTGMSTVTAGTPVSFTFSGDVRTISMYSGEQYHEYRYADEDRLEPAASMMSFMNALSAGNQPNCTSVKVSADFSGVMTEESIIAATWTDITDRFTMPGEIKGDLNPVSKIDTYNQYFVKSGECDLAPYFTDSKKLYIAFFYHIDQYQAAKDNKRTGSYITCFKVEGQYEMSKTNISLVSGKNMSGVLQQPGWITPATSAGVPDAPCFRFFADLSPKTDRDAYAVTTAPISPNYVNKGHDTPISVKGTDEVMPSRFEYTFKEPGTYEVVFVSQSMTITGASEEQIHKIEIVVK